MTPRNLMGFREGGNNLRSASDLDRHVWIHAGDRSWMTGGTYLVRRIRVLLELWDGLPVDGQERVIGRRKVTGETLGQPGEDVPVQEDGRLVTPVDATRAWPHRGRTAAPACCAAATTSSTASTVTPVNSNAGLLFLAHQRPPTPVRAAAAAACRSGRAFQHVLHTGSAVFAVPPAARAAGFIGEGLFGDNPRGN